MMAGQGQVADVFAATEAFLKERRRKEEDQARRARRYTPGQEQARRWVRDLGATAAHWPLSARHAALPTCFTAQTRNHPLIPQPLHAPCREAAATLMKEHLGWFAPMFQAAVSSMDTMVNGDGSNLQVGRRRRAPGTRWQDRNAATEAEVYFPEDSGAGAG